MTIPNIQRKKLSIACIIIQIWIIHSTDTTLQVHTIISLIFSTMKQVISHPWTFSGNLLTTFSCEFNPCFRIFVLIFIQRCLFHSECCPLIFLQQELIQHIFFIKQPDFCQYSLIFSKNHSNLASNSRASNRKGLIFPKFWSSCNEKYYIVLFLWGVLNNNLLYNSNESG